jgi:polyhydroxybutyrate depolymerase
MGTTLSARVRVGTSQHWSFTWHLPPGPSTEPRPLLIALHGRNLTVEEFRRITHFDAVADRHGFVLVYPEGYQRSWNDGRGNTPAEQEGVDDSAFIRALIDRLAEQVGIDPARVAVTGLSNGGVMCHRLGLELSDRIASIAPVAGLMPVALSDMMPDHAVSVLLIQGDRDISMPITGGRAHGRARILLVLGGVRTRAGPVLSLDATIARWREINGCTDETHRDPLPASGGDPTSVERIVYPGGREATEVECWIVHGGGHTWPGGPRLMGLGRTSTHFNSKPRTLNVVRELLLAAPAGLLLPPVRAPTI